MNAAEPPLQQEQTSHDHSGHSSVLNCFTEAAEQLKTKFFIQLCAADRDVAFYVGNQAARPQAFSIGGVYAPKRPTTRYRLRINR